ncbi:MAG: 50S ribosomal protein L16 [bacterium]|jgi:large subunit ribosomal protein L16
MLQPKRVKFRKTHRGNRRGKAYRGSSISFGDYGLQALEPVWLTARQIEAARIVLTRSLSKGGKLWIRVFPQKPITKHPAEARMGGGKGAPEYWVAVVKPGRIIFEVTGISEQAAQEAMRHAGHKLPLKTRFLSRLMEEGAQA